MPELEFDASYETHRRKRLRPIDVPFVGADRSEVAEISCVHCTQMQGMIGNQFPDDRFRAVIAMYAKEQLTGMYQAYTAQDCRTLADALMRMAEAIDKENGDA